MSESPDYVSYRLYRTRDIRDGVKHPTVMPGEYDTEGTESAHAEQLACEVTRHRVTYCWLCLDITVANGNAFKIKTDQSFVRLHQLQLVIGRRGIGKTVWVSNFWSYCGA